MIEDPLKPSKTASDSANSIGVRQDLGHDVSASERVDEVVGMICAGALGLLEIEAGSDIFDLGADSIHVVQIAALLQAEYNVDLSYMEIFDNPTVRGISALVRTRMAG
jgi:acyl carrier protein